MALFGRLGPHCQTWFRGANLNTPQASLPQKAIPRQQVHHSLAIILSRMRLEVEVPWQWHDFESECCSEAKTRSPASVASKTGRQGLFKPLGKSLLAAQAIATSKRAMKCSPRIDGQLLIRTGAPAADGNPVFKGSSNILYFRVEIAGSHVQDESSSRDTVLRSMASFLS